MTQVIEVVTQGGPQIVEVEITSGPQVIEAITRGQQGPAGDISTVNGEEPDGEGNLSLEAGDIPFTPAGSIEADDVQEAIEELDSEKQPIDADLTALAGLSGTGLVARTGAATFTERTLTGTANEIEVSNGDGVAGNPVIGLVDDVTVNSVTVADEAYDATGWNADLSVPTKNAVRDYLETLTGTTLPSTYQPLDSDLTALAGNSSNGIWARTGSGTGVARTITGTANEITVSNGDGVSGDPVISLPDDITVNSVTVADEAYDATGWNSDLTAPTKNAVRDYLETLTGTTLPATYQPLDSDLTDLSTKWAAASASSAARLDFAEDTDNGSHRVRIQAPASLAGDITLTLPVDDGDSGQVLSTDGDGNLSWIGSGGNAEDVTVSPTVLGESDVQAVLEALDEEISARRVGEFFWYLADNPPDYALELDGSAVSRTTYSRLWAWVQTSGNLAASEEAKQDGEFGPGDGSTTFTLPNLVTDFRFVRASTTVGAEQAQSTQTHYHRTALGFDGGSYYAWRDGGNAPIFGSDVVAATRYSFAVGGSGTTGRFARTETATVTGGNTHPVNVTMLPCVVF